MMQESDCKYYFSSSEEEDDEEEEISLSGPNQDQKLWDSFQDPPISELHGSSVDSKFITNSIKFMKVLTYWFVLLIVATSGVLSKLSFLLMTSNVNENTKIIYCDTKIPEKKLLATIPNEQNIAWRLAIVFAFSIPEIGTWLRAIRLCFFKKVKNFGWEEFGIVIFIETLYVIGMSLMAFAVLPELDGIQGVMLTNCFCLIPAVLSMLCHPLDKPGNQLKKVLDICSIVVQSLGLLIWPIFLPTGPKIWFLPLSITFISCHWWENYVTLNSPWEPIQYLAYIKDKCYQSRYKIFAIVAPYKIFMFFSFASMITGTSFSEFFEGFDGDFGNFTIKIEEIKANLNQRFPDFNDIINDLYKTEIRGDLSGIWWILLLHAASSYTCYIFGKFACKIHIQTFSFSFPINLVVPLTVSTLIVLCGLRQSDVCYFHGTLPDYIFFKTPPEDFLFAYIFKYFIWFWVFWLFSQSWVTRHLWKPKGMRNACTEKIFVLPTYDSLIIDQSLALNRRRDEQEDFILDENHQPIEYPQPSNIIDAKAFANNVNKEGISPKDYIPQIFVCATMWHETKEELIEFLKSILRLDEDQCARRMAMKYLQVDKEEIDSEYYDLETHIFFDDAFVDNKKLCESPEATPINSYVKLLINNVEEAAWEVYKVRMKIPRPIKIVTPYGGRLIWTLPGRTKMIAHLKDKNKIRHKKRWSQCMYMYYLLGYRIMQLDASPERKRVIAQNTYLLALDGDIDFQPKAVHLLIDRMKNDPNLGGACGRIHPVGKGPMVWYQNFEYAIGHWLQKATEHVIGCVLCSPGCFSLFRGRALMENSVMKKYTTKSDQARHYIQYDQGEDRWLCTLILKQKYRVEYCAASDAYTHAPEGFNEFYNQRRRWVPSTIANIFDLLGDAERICKVNNNISRPYIFYQVVLMFGTIIGPGTIFLMMVSAIQSVFLVDIYIAFLYNFVPLCVFMLVCYFCKQKFQLVAAFIISVIYSLIMMAVMVGIMIQVIEDGILAPSSLFFFTVTLQIIITGILHPQEMHALPAGFVYYVTIPCMYMLLTIYSLFNMNDVSWGTRENPQEAKVEEKQPKRMNKIQKILGYFKTPTDDEEEGSLDISIAGLFRCMFCTHKKVDTTGSQLLHIGASISELNHRIKNLEHKLTQNISIHSDDEEMNENSDEFEDVPLIPKEDTKGLLPDWLYDPDLKDGDTETISAAEEQFWVDLIDKYLTPIDMTTKYKENMQNQLKAYRDIAVFAFTMSNALFVLIVFLLQLNKQYLKVRWPFNVQNDIFFDQATFEFTIRREYTYLEPISMLFVAFFGLVLIVQFIAMLFHRFATISQILATTKIDWYCSKTVKETISTSELKEKAVEIARFLQKPKPEWEYDEDERGNEIRRDTIHQLLLQQKKFRDWSNLETNFKRELFKSSNLNLKKLKLAGRTISILDEMRKSMAEFQRNVKSTMIQNPYMTSNGSSYSLATSVYSDKDSFTIYQRTSYLQSKNISPIPSVIYSTAPVPLKSALKRSKTTPAMQIFGIDNMSFVNDEENLNFDVKSLNFETKEHNNVAFADFNEESEDDLEDEPIEMKIYKNNGV